MINFFFNSRQKWTADIPIAQDATSRFVPWIIALLVFLLCLVMAGAFSLNSSLFKWHSGNPGKVTIEVPMRPQQDRQKTVSTITNLVIKVPGVLSIIPLNTDRLLTILEPWVGNPDVLKDLPLPLLFDVEIQPNITINWQDVATSLRHISAGARLEFHSRWHDTLSILRSSLQLIAYIFSALIAIAVLTTIMLVTKSGLDAHNQNIRTLQLLGANSSYISQEFQWQILKIATKGSVIGSLVAFPLIVILNWMSTQLSIPEIIRPEISWSIAFVMVGVPCVIVGLSLMVARLSVAYTLSKL